MLPFEQLRGCPIRFALLLLATALTTGCAGFADSAWRTFAHDGRLQKRSDNAWLLLEADRAVASEEAYRELRARAKDDPFEAYGHARAFAVLGRPDEAWSALDDAVRLGFKDPWRLEGVEHAFTGRHARRRP